jgi:hypothetical protein
MAGDIKQKYPAASNDTVAITISLASLSSDTTLLAGRESTVVDNTTNVDIDHLVSGVIRVGTAPTASREIRVYAYAPRKIASGTPTYLAAVTGSDANLTIASANVRDSALRLLWATLTDTTTDRDYFMPPTSIAQAFGEMPPYWGLWVTQASGIALNSTSGNHELHYHRIQKQYT